MPIEFREPDVKSCNLCPSMEAIVKVCFVTNLPRGESSTNIRFCRACFCEAFWAMGDKFNNLTREEKA
jgi:hypothetical protein